MREKDKVMKKEKDINICAFGFQNRVVPIYNDIGSLINTCLLIAILLK